ncbi:MAG: hypothetical protein IJE27_02245, partial [Anaerotignum sp.]|nr:hypothetical protein [Anaerotignum sp.]
MTKLTHNLGAKILACFLVILTGFTAIGSGIGAYYAYENGFYRNHAKPYHKTFSCQRITYQYSSGLIDHLHTNAWNYHDQEAFSPENTNYRYRIKTESGEILMENLNPQENAVPVSENIFTLSPIYVEENHEVIIDAVGDAEKADVIVEGYIVEPPTVSDDYSQSYWLHQNIYGIHDALSAILGVSLLVFALC